MMKLIILQHANAAGGYSAATGIEEALSLYRTGKTLIIIIDDAHLMEIDTLRRIRLLLEDFPKNHNLILAGQPELLSLVVRSSDGIPRRARNLCLSALLEAVRDQKKIIDLDIVNKILIQPHWRTENDIRHIT